VVAELVHAVVSEPALRAAVLATQQPAIDELRRTRFGDLLQDRLAPVLGAAGR
jgi:hypothetical protein